MPNQHRGNGEGSVYRVMVERKDGPVERWIAQVVVDGRKRRVTALTEAAAKKELRHLLRSIDDGKPIADGNLTLGALLTEWDSKVLAGRDISGSTLMRHRWALGILRAELGSTRVRTLTPERVESALAARADAGLSRASLEKVRGTLSQVLNWAVRREIVFRNIASVVELPASSRPAKEGRSLTLDQAQSLLAAASGTPLEAMWTTMLFLGLRPGEAAGLSWPDIDFESGVIHIWRARRRDATGRSIISDPKTAQSVRSLTAPEPVLDSLRRHRREHARHRLEIGEMWVGEEDLVFTSPTGRPTDPAACRREFDVVAKKAGLDGWTPNELRHSAASLMSDAGMPIEQVADQLGHKDLRMLQRHYRHRIRPTVDGGTVLGDVLGRR